MTYDVQIYTDGSFSGKSKYGGWASVLHCNGQELVLTGNATDTTNNRMELLAVIEALSILTTPCNVSVYSDSQYVVNAISQNWMKNWKKRNWRTADGKPVKNQDLWERIILLMEVHRISAYWVRGHNGNPLNELCDVVSRNMLMQLYNTV